MNELRYEFEQVAFESEGSTLRGRFYRPRDESPYPVVVMAHGFTATIQMTIDRYAERLQAAGMAVLLYDHRNIGASDGTPRNEVNSWIQARGYRDAVTYAVSRQDVDPQRIALWGDSHSAAVVLVLGALEPRARVVIAQIPSCGPEIPHGYPGGAINLTCETFLTGDVAATPETTTGPMPVVSFDQHGLPSHLKPLTAFRWFIEYGGRFGSQWENWATRVMPVTPVPFSPYIAAPHICSDVLMMMAPNDEIVHANPEVARATFERIPSYKELAEIDQGHFGLLHYPSDTFEHAAKAQCDFLRRRLLN